MVLDSGGDEIFIWIGKGSTPEEKIYSHRLADVCTYTLKDNINRLKSKCTLNFK